MYKARWYWFKNISECQIAILLLRMATEDANTFIRFQAADMYLQLTLTQIPNNLEIFIRRAINDQSSQVRLLAIKILAEADRLDLLHLQTEDKIDPEALRLRSAVPRAAAMRTAPTDEFRELLKDDSNPHDIVKSALELVRAQNDKEALTTAINHRSSWVRNYAVEELERRQLLDEPVLEQLTKDSDSTIRSQGFRLLIERGKILFGKDHS